MRFSGLLYIVSGILAIIIILFSYNHSGEWISYYLVFPAIMATSIYLLETQLNLWWNKRFPPRLDPKVKRIFEHYSTYYKELDPKTQRLFDSRIAIFIDDKTWINVGSEDDLAYDVKAIIAFNPVRMTLSHKDFLFPTFDRIIVYPYPFLSPVYPGHYHASEINFEDKVFVFSLKHIIPAFQQPEKYFNIALYEFARAFRHLNPEIQFPEQPKEFWINLYDVANYGFNEIRNLIGIPDSIDDFGVAVHHYFVYGEYFRNVFPDIFNQLEGIFSTYRL